MKRLFEIASRAKTIGGGQDYRLPNMIFCWVLEAFFWHHQDGLWSTEDGEEIALRLETNDPSGSNLDETYYDLLVIQWSSDDEEDSMVIPLPLLRPLSVGTAMKVVEIVDRGDHCRDLEDSEEGERRRLFDEAVEIFEATRDLSCGRYGAERDLSVSDLVMAVVSRHHTEPEKVLDGVFSR